MGYYIFNKVLNLTQKREIEKVPQVMFFFAQQTGRSKKMEANGERGTLRHLAGEHKLVLYSWRVYQFSTTDVMKI